MSESFIDIENLSVGIDLPGDMAIPILRDVSLRVAPGQTLGLVGESGSGKSTIALSIMGYLPDGLSHLQGKVSFDGYSMFEINPTSLEDLRGGEICLIPQNAGQSLTPTMSIGQQIDEALMLHTDIAKGERRAATIALLTQVRLPQPDEIANRFPHELSGGQQQRCAIAMALAGKPRALLLDEPTTGLDVTTQVHILELLKDLAESRGVAMIFVSHDLGAIARVSDHIAVLYSGELIEYGSSTQILRNPEHPYTRGLIDSIPRIDGGQLPEALKGYPPTLTAHRQACAFAARCDFVKDVCQSSVPELEIRKSERKVRCHFRADELEFVGEKRNQVRGSKENSNQPLLYLKNIGISYGKKSFFSRFLSKKNESQVLTVDGISFSLNQGETIGIVGESGSGKSTILRAIVGMLPPSKGEMKMTGDYELDCPSDDRSLECKKDIQMIFQNPDSALNPRKTVAEIISAPLELYFGVDHESARSTAVELLRSVRLTPEYLDRCPGQLSGGEKQRVGIARAFAAVPKLALCDEVTSALDVSVQAAVLELLANLQRELGVAYLFVSHDLTTVRAVADRVLVLYQGRICEIGPTESVYHPPLHPYTEALMGAVLEPDPDTKPKIFISDTIESSPPKQGCPFQRRCQRKLGTICETERPPARPIEDGHTIYCHIELDELKTLQTPQ